VPQYWLTATDNDSDRVTGRAVSARAHSLPRPPYGWWAGVPPPCVPACVPSGALERHSSPSHVALTPFSSFPRLRPLRPIAIGEEGRQPTPLLGAPNSRGRQLRGHGELATRRPISVMAVSALSPDSPHVPFREPWRHAGDGERWGEHRSSQSPLPMASSEPQLSATRSAGG